MQNTHIQIDESTQKEIDAWLAGDYDEASKNEIRRLKKENPEELLDAFYTHLSFGTGGLRGIMGVGSNRMNIYTVSRATQGLANYIQKTITDKKEHKVLVGFDCRHHSREFAEETAKVLAGNGIKVFLYKDLRPVALISYGVLYKKCIAGILITASHNPPKYNGYKVYWKNGAQVLPPHDKGIIEEVGKIKANHDVKKSELSNSLIHEVGEEIDQSYLEAIRKYQLYSQDNKDKGKKLQIVYTPLHGAGITIIPKALQDWGFTSLSLVEKQINPDGDFPTVKSPNPEEKDALALGVEDLKRLEADILMATDPDTDRLGVVIIHENQPFYFSGNEIACLLLEHICSALKENNRFPPKAMFIKTIVTTELFSKIVESHDGMCLDVLTGFKYIGEKISDWEEESLSSPNFHHFIFGAEESYGYLYGTHVRDKDAIISATTLAEAVLHLKLSGKTLVDFLYEIYLKYGVYREKLISLTFEGKEGAEKMKNLMVHLRKNPPKEFIKIPVDTIEDYLSRTSFHLKSGKKEPLTLPKSDVLRFWLEDETKLVIRPSGTEPKIKIYVAAKEKHHANDKKAMLQAIQSCDQKLISILEETKKWI